MVPESWRPIGIKTRKAVMHTPLSQQGDTFAATVESPEKSIIDFGFLITKSRSGRSIEVWEADGSRNFHRVITPGLNILVASTGRELEPFPEIPSVPIEMRYDIGETGEVYQRLPNQLVDCTTHV